MSALLAGWGAEEAIGRLLRLTSLRLSVHKPRPGLDFGALSPWQPPPPLQLLGSQAGSGGVGGSGGGSNGSNAASGAQAATGHSAADGAPAAVGPRNTSLQRLALEVRGALSDAELAAAAAGLPSLQTLEVSGSLHKVPASDLAEIRSHSEPKGQVQTSQLMPAWQTDNQQHQLAGQLAAI